MTAQRPATVGVCPSCDAEITRYDVLIEYETAGGEARYAECPGCHDVVSPE